MGNKEEKLQPRMRFKGFTDAWEKRKLGEVAEFLNGRAYKQNELLDNGKYPVLRVGNFNTNDKWYYSDLELPEKNYANEGDLLYTWATAFGPHIWHGQKVIYHYHIWKVNLSDALEKDFTVQLLRADQEQMTNNLNGSTMVHITKGTMEKKVVTIPNIIEQSKLGTLFAKLDNLIAVNQRKVENLRQLKTGLLQKMFVSEGSEIPEIRFAGFTDAWEKRKLGEVAKRITRKNVNLESTRPLTISAQYGLIDQNDFFDKQVASKDVSGYFLVKKGEFAYNKSYSNGFPLGAIKRLDMYDSGVLSTLYIVFRPTSVDSQFLVSYYDSSYWYKEVNKNAAEGARNHGLLNIAPSDFFNTVLRFPRVSEEQTKIGTFFAHLDNLIAVNQRKVELLQKLKKGYLQNLFA